MAEDFKVKMCLQCSPREIFSHTNTKIKTHSDASLLEMKKAPEKKKKSLDKEKPEEVDMFFFSAFIA